MSEKTKIASKNNPTQRQKVAKQKIYKDKPIKPVRYIDRDLHMDYISAEYSKDGSLVQDESGNPIKWEAI